MSTPKTIFNNYATMRIEGRAALSAAGAVSSYVGDGITVTKNGTGLYDVSYTNPDKHRVFEVIGYGASLADATIGTVKDVGVETQPAQSATADEITMTFHTVDAAGADVDEATTALDVCFWMVVRVNRMTMPFT